MPRCHRCGKHIKSGDYGPVCVKKVNALFDLAEYPPIKQDRPQVEQANKIKPLLVTWDLFQPRAIDRDKPINEQHTIVTKIIGE
jgi:hypothetical protein